MRTGKVLLVMVAVLAMAGAAGAQEYVPLFDARGVSESGKAVNINNRWAFDDATVTVYCQLEGTAYVVTDDGDGTYSNPIVDNYITAGNDSFSICTGGVDLPDPIAGTNCFNSADGTRPLGTPLENLYNSIASAPVNLTAGENTITFKLWDWGSSYGNTKLVLELPDSCSTTPPFEVNLCAAQEIPAGNLAVTDDGTTLTVNYTAAEGYAFNEIHVDVGCIVDGAFVGIPVNKQDQPKIGNFAYSVEYDEPVTMDSFDFNLCDIEAEGCSLDDLIIAAHAVVADVAYCQQNAIVYGVHQGTNAGNGAGFDLFAVNVVADGGPEAAQIFSTNTTPAPGDQSRLNGLAFDPSGDGRLYYASSTGGDEVTVATSELWYHDLGSGVEYDAGMLDNFDVGATFYDGTYYYIANCTAEVHRVTIDPISNTVSADDVVVDDFNGDSTDVYRFGDFVVLDGGVLFGSAQVVDPANGNCGNSGRESTGNIFFTVDLNDPTDPQFTVIGDPTDGTRQLAIGSDGTLYGHNTGTGIFSTIDPSNGLETPIGGPAACVSEDPTCDLYTGKFNDLASGLRCVPPTETAWGGACEYDGTTPGEGYPFVNRGSWATYIEYTVYGLPTCE